MSRGRGAGAYWERVRIHQRATAADAGTGFKRPTYTPSATCWAYTKDVKADKKLAYGITNSIVETEIHIRGYPALDARDRLEVLTAGYYCDIKGITLDYDAGETVVMAKRIPTLEATA